MNTTAEKGNICVNLINPIVYSMWYKGTICDIYPNRKPEYDALERHPNERRVPKTHWLGSNTDQVDKDSDKMWFPKKV